MDWFNNTEIGLDPNNSVIKRLRCMPFSKQPCLHILGSEKKIIQNFGFNIQKEKKDFFFFCWSACVTYPAYCIYNYFFKELITPSDYYIYQK